MTAIVSLEQTQALIAEIDKEINKSPNMGISKTLITKRGVEGGTYACKEVVVAYGAWISANVHLAVIRAFLDSVDNNRATSALAIPKTLHEALRLAADFSS